MMRGFWRWNLAAVACAATFACLGAAPAGAAPAVRVDAAPHGKVKVGVVAAASRGRLVYVLDHRRVRVTRRHAISLSVPHHRGSEAVWHRLAIRRAGSKRVLASTRFAVAARSSRSAPTLVLLDAPPAQTGANSAVLRFAATTKVVACSHNSSAFQRCGSPVSFSGLAPGAHRFTIRAGRRHTSSLTVASDVLAQPVAPPAPVASTPPPSSQPSDSKPPPIGSSVPGADGRRLLFEDDFSGTQLNTSSWSPYNGTGYNGHGLRRPYAVTLDGQGHLVITAQMINGALVTGGMANGLNRPYGLYEFRVRTDPDPTHNVSGAVLTWPQSGRFPQDGENDIYETGTYYPRDPFFSFIHFGTTASSQTSFKHYANASDWHTMAMDWSSGAIKIYRDGALVWTVTDPAVIPDVAHHLAIQLDALGSGQLTGPVRMYVDWVRIYQ
jgi:beta-glucanase (GH16 family)